MTERWLPIDKWPAYEISDLGRVRRILPRKSWPTSGVGEILRPNMPKRGYLSINLTRDGPNGRHEQGHFELHRLVVLTFIGPIAKDMTVNHKDLDKSNAALSNLEIVSRSENSRHAYLNGRLPYMGSLPGEKHGRATLTDAQAQEILIRGSRGIDLAVLAREFGVPRETVSNIVRRRTWKHLAFGKEL